MNDQRPFAAEMPWPDFHARMKDGKTPILIPLGSMEQHGHHMPLHVDVLLPTEFSRRVAARVGGSEGVGGYRSDATGEPAVDGPGQVDLPGEVATGGGPLVSAVHAVAEDAGPDERVEVEVEHVGGPVALDRLGGDPEGQRPPLGVSRKRAFPSAAFFT